jgi:putative CocE/NonD family hydrolase
VSKQIVEQAVSGADVRLDCSIPMRDGARLAADVYLPPGAGVDNEVPTILVRTSYDKSQPEPNIRPSVHVGQGFAVVLEDVRGRYASDGDFYHGIHEVEDGFDTLEWIAAQPWSNGKVGMVGISYLAAVQCSAACSGSPYLSSIMHVFAPTDYYESCHRQAGNAALYYVPIVFMFASTSRAAMSDPVLSKSLADAFENSRDWLDRVPLKRGLTPFAAVPGVEWWYHEVMEHSEYDEFWSKVVLWEPHEYVDQYADIPGLYVGGWYDTYREEQFFELLAPKKRGPINLLIGPWTHLHFHGHDVTTKKDRGDVDFGPSGELSLDDYFALQLEWFTRTLKEDPQASTDRKPVRIFVMGGGDGHKTGEGKMFHGGRWRDEDAWPLPRTEYQAGYLHSGGTLSFEAPAGDSPSTAYVFDPSDPVPTIGGVHYFIKPNRDTFVPYGAHDQRERKGAYGCKTELPLSSRHDVLVFQTPPLEEDVEITGTPIAHLWVSSSAVDTDFTAKLIDVYPPNEDYPDGYAMNLADGVRRMRYRDSYTTPTLMEPAKIYEVEIKLYATSNLFQRGHRIRVDISSSNFPAFDVNQNNGGSLTKRDKLPIVAENTIYHSPEHASYIRLPIIPIEGASA